MILGKKNPGSITHVKPTGNLILVEMLTEQECLGTRLLLGKTKKPSAPQGYVLDIGPGLSLQDWGFKVGDRVLLQGSFVPVPNYRQNNERDLGLVNAHDIKCVLAETVDED